MPVSGRGFRFVHCSALAALSPVEALALADRIGSRLGGDDEARARHHFTLPAR